MKKRQRKNSKSYLKRIPKKIVKARPEKPVGKKLHYIAWP